ncbi:MAG: hypothetical protein ACYTHM_05555 [Planctomycetota bacterium]|jgi:hypothetical protein
MKPLVRLCTLGILAALAACPCPTPSQEGDSPRAKPLLDRSSPEMTLRSFWSAIRRGDKASALACTDPGRISQGRDGRDVHALIDEYGKLNPAPFRYIASPRRCSIQSPTHNMDYEMEKDAEGRWVIVSIHP